MNYQNDDLRIKEIKELLPPVALLEKFPATENAANTVAHARKAIHKILKGNDDRLLSDSRRTCYSFESGKYL